MRRLAFALVLATGCSSAAPRSPSASTTSDRDTVTVLDYRGIGIGDVTIAVQSQSGSIVKTYRTGQDGTVRVKLFPGASVTRYSQYDPKYVDVETVYGVDEGPVRFQQQRKNPLPVPATTTFQITVTGIPAGAVGVMAHMRCTDAFSATGTLTMDDGYCPWAPEESFFAVAVDLDYRPISWGWTDAVPTLPGGTVPVSIDVGHTGFVERTVSMTDLAGDPPSDAFGSVEGWFAGSWDGIGVVPGFETAASSTAGTWSWTKLLPDAPLPFWATFAGASFPAGDQYAASIATTSGGDAFSFAGLPLMDVAPLAIGMHGASMEWTAPGEVVASVAVGRTGWMTADGHNVTFTGVAPPGAAGTIVIPDFPADLSDFAPGTGATPGSVAIDLVRSTTLPTWADVLADPTRSAGQGVNPATVLVSTSRSP